MTGHWTAELGFEVLGEGRWTRGVRGRRVVLRELRTLGEMAPVENLQREVMGVSDLDLMPANGLIVIPETGGSVLAAEVGGKLAGALWGFGGYVDGRARIVSDWMGVRAAYRSLGLGAELKRLQAALALSAGIDLIVWTVDPLRAANARLNIFKLGATSRRYEIDRYGGYAAGLYGDMPTDRLHMEWDLRDPLVLGRIRGAGSRPGAAQSTAARAETPVHQDEMIDPPRRRVAIPSDIDALVLDDPETALAWRLRVREQVQGAFAEGFVLDGFEPGDGMSDPALILTARGRGVGKEEAK